MKARAWSHGPIRVEFTLYAPALEKGRTLHDYTAGILDTLDGSSGYSFTYLPVVFEDDSQICELCLHFVEGKSASYKVKFEVVEDCPANE